MKQIKLLVASFCLISSLSQAQAPSWIWARSGDNQNNSGRSVAKDLAEDKYGNVYVLGGYAGTMNFGAASFTATGSVGIYLLKYDASGTLLWAKAVENASSVLAQSVVVDSNGDAYIAGTFSDSAVFDNVTLTSKGFNDVFLAKFSAGGQLKWAKSFGSSFDEFMQRGLAIDSRNNIVICGTFATGIGSNATISFDSYTLTSKGRPNIFLAKFNNDGDAIWAKTAGDEPGTYGNALAVDKQDNIYIVGEFLGPGPQAHFDNITINSSNIGLITGTAFLAKYDSSGTAIWAQAIGGKRPVGGNDFGAIQGTLVTTDSSGNVLVGGNYQACAIIVGNDILEPGSYYAGEYDIWFAKFSSGGDPVWAKKAGSPWQDYLRGISADNAGNVYITGEHGNVCIFDNDTAFIPATGPALIHMFVCKYGPDGTLRWLNSIGGEYNAIGLQVITDRTGAVIISGGFSAPALSFGTSTIHNGGSNNGFIAKMSILTGIGTVRRNNPDVEIYPNPASDKLFVRSAASGAFTGYTLVNVLGRKMAEGRMEASHVQSISLPSLPDGLYYLNLSGRDVFATKKISILH